MPDLLRRLADDVEEEDWSLLSVNVGVHADEPAGQEYLTALYEPMSDAARRRAQ